MKHNLLIISVFAVNLIVSCSKDETTTPPVSTNECTGVTSTYTNDVASIFNSSCATSGCHSAASKANGIDLSNYNSAKNVALSSKLLQAIKHESGATPMPNGQAKLSPDKIKKVTCWIQNGTPQ